MRIPIAAAILAGALAAPAFAHACPTPRAIHREARTDVYLTADSLNTQPGPTACEQHERGPRRPWYCRTTFDDGSRLWQKIIYRRPRWTVWTTDRWIVWDAQLDRADGAIE